MYHRRGAVLSNLIIDDSDCTISESLTEGTKCLVECRVTLKNSGRHLGNQGADIVPAGAISMLTERVREALNLPVHEDADCPTTRDAVVAARNIRLSLSSCRHRPLAITCITASNAGRRCPRGDIRAFVSKAPVRAVARRVTDTVDSGGGGRARLDGQWHWQQRQ